MNYGLYLSASGVLTNTYRQDVFANNLANVETNGFKPDMPMLRQRDAESVEDHLGFDVSNEIMDKLGGGALAAKQRINFAPGTLKATGNALDVALTKKNQFFAVETLDASGQATVALTRNGNFMRNDAGELVTQTGKRVLDNSDQPIVIDGPVEPTIDSAGNVQINGQTVAQLQVTSVVDLDGLKKLGEGLFTFTGEDIRQPVDAETIVLQQGYLEASGTNAITEMMNVVSASKAVTSNANMLRYHDQLLDRAVNTLGRVA